MAQIQKMCNTDIPSIGLGTWKINDKQLMQETIESAYDCGYRLFDTAAAYANEIALGKALIELQIPRKQIFLQDKLWKTCYGYEASIEACKKSLKKLKTDYLDLYMMHWPITSMMSDEWATINAETWRGLETLYKEGYVRSIGVCNFKRLHLDELKKSQEIAPSVNQIEMHPGMFPSETLAYCKDNGILVEAASPLGSGEMLKNDTLQKLADAKGVSIAQICLKWEVKHRVIPLPKSTNEKRLRENLQLDGFDLSDNEMKRIDEMEYCGGIGIDPDEVTDIEGL